MLPAPLSHRGDVSEAQFGEYFQSKLGPLYAQALELFRRYGAINSYKVANAIHIGLETGRAGQILDALNDWAEIAYTRPYEGAELIRRELDTRQFFDVMYREVFDDKLAALGSGSLILPNQASKPQTHLTVPNQL
jgi:hypothetical protein